MRVNVQYAAQIKTAAKVPGCRVEVPQDTQLLDLVKQLAADGTDELRNLLLDPQGAVHPTLLLFVGDELVPRAVPRPLRDGETVAIMSPMSGG